MAIDGGLRERLAVGTVLTARYKGAEYAARVIPGEEGKVRFQLPDGREFKSPSAAASAVMGGQAANGWRFWSVAGEEPAETTTPGRKRGSAGAETSSAITSRVRPQCPRCGKSFVGAKQLAHHQANADRLCTPA